MKPHTFYLEIFATAFAALLLEIAYTRIFSFKVYYYFTYLIIGLGLLGIGAGGVAVAISERLRRWDPARLVSLCCIVGGVSVLVGYLVIAPLELNVSDVVSKPAEVGKLAFASVLLTVPFGCVGIVLSTILGSRPDLANRLYGVDLIGAALACVLAIPLLKAIDPPRAVVLAGLVLSLGGLRSALASRALTIATAASLVVIAIPLVAPSLLKDPVVARAKTYEDFRKAKLVRYSKWNPVFRIDVCDHPTQPGLYLLHHDGMPGSGLRRFNGDFKTFGHLRNDSRALPFEVLPKGPKVLVIGSAGGHEIVSSLYFGAEHVTGIELNSATMSVVTDVFADISGRLHENPRVTLINGDGRWFMKKTDEQYDLIWFVAPDSYAAMNAATSGSFVLSESYLYTVEMLRDSLQRLTPHGVICTQFGELDYANRPNRTTRYLATARAALRDSGIRDFDRHVMVAGGGYWPPLVESAILLSKRPFSPEQAERFVAHTGLLKSGVVRHVPGLPPDPSPVSQVIALPDSVLPAFFAAHPYQVNPVHDDSPFFWHFARFSDALRAPLPGGLIIDYEDVIAEQVMLVLLGLIVVLAAGLLLLPFARIRPIWSAIPYKTPAALYFAALGLGFMFVEVALIQKLTLFLGYPTYSLSVTLFGILVFSGLGSIVSARWVARRNHALSVLFIAVLALIGVYQFFLPWLVDRFVGSALPLRVALTIVLIAPLGVCLGAFMPLGLRTVASLTEHRREYVAWAWAVNGFFSVIASILSTILAMVIGFRLLLLTAVAVYAVGVFALSRIPSEPLTRAARR